MPLRLSFIVPCNLVLDTLMMSGAPPAVHALIFFPPLSHIQPPLHPARGTMQVVGAQWLNQTYNALHYRANRNASNEEEGWEVAQAYCGATASSVAAADGGPSVNTAPSRGWSVRYLLTARLISSGLLPA